MYKRYTQINYWQDSVPPTAQWSTSNHCLKITLHISLFFLLSAYVLPGTFITLYFVLRNLCLLPGIRSTL